MQRTLWRELSHLSSVIFPLLILGDFNAIQFANKHKGGNFLYYTGKSKFFNEFITKNALLDIHYMLLTSPGAMAGLAREDGLSI